MNTLLLEGTAVGTPLEETDLKNGYSQRPSQQGFISRVPNSQVVRATSRAKPPQIHPSALLRCFYTPLCRGKLVGASHATMWYAGSKRLRPTLRIATATE